MKKSILTSLIAASALFTGVAFAGSYTADAGYTSADTSSIASSEDSLAKGWYVGVGTNRTAENNYKTDNSYADVNSTTSSADTQKFGFGALVGKHINDIFAVEAAYNSYGTNTFTGNSQVDGVVVSNYSTDYYGMWSATVLGVVNTPEFNGLSAHAKAGAAYFSENFKDSATPVASPTTADVTTGSYSGANFAYGFGAQYNFKQFGVSLDWTRIDVSSSTSNNQEAYVPDQYSLTLLYNFA